MRDLDSWEDFQGEAGIAGWDWEDWYQQIFQFVYLVVAMSTTFKFLSVVQVCVFASKGGVGLALRGPDGSLQSAVSKMRIELERQSVEIRDARKGLAVAIMLLAVVRFSLMIGLPLALTAIPKIWKAASIDRDLEREYHLDEAKYVKVSWIKRIRRHAFGRRKGEPEDEEDGRRGCLSVCLGRGIRGPGTAANGTEERQSTAHPRTVHEVDALIHTQQDKLMPEEAAARIQAARRGQLLRRRSSCPDDGEASPLSRLAAAATEWPPPRPANPAGAHAATAASEVAFMDTVNLVLFPGGTGPSWWPGQQPPPPPPPPQQQQASGHAVPQGLRPGEAPAPSPSSARSLVVGRGTELELHSERSMDELTVGGSPMLPGGGSSLTASLAPAQARETEGTIERCLLGILPVPNH